MKKRVLFVLSGIILTIFMPIPAFASAASIGDVASNLRVVQQYNFSIQILAMLLVGFGFLMVFVKKYGYSATTGTYLVVGVGIPLYLLLRSTGIISSEAVDPQTIKALLFAEFAVAAALISMGAVLGRLRVYQYALISIFLVPLYMLNEWLVLDGGLGVTKGFVDAAGSIVIHAFGAYFGLGLAIALTKRNQLDKVIESDATSDRFAMLGSMILKGKPSIADIANASLAGGICVIGYNVIQPALQKKLKIVDTCGVHNLHGMPGLLGGIIAVFVVPDAAKAQVIGIVFTVALALIGGIVAGNIIKFTGSKVKIYEDSDEFTEA